MRITGIAIAFIGVVIALFCGITAMNYKAPSESDTVVHTEQRRSPDLTFPLLVAGAAVLGGGALWLYGSRGYRDHTPPGTHGMPPAVQG